MLSFASPASPRIDLTAELPVAVVVTDPTGTILEMNDAAIELFAQARGDCLGKDLASFIQSRPHDDVDQLPVTGTRGPGEALPSRARLRCPDGAYRAIEVRRRVLADGRVVNVLLEATPTALDTDALRASERQLNFVANSVPALLAFVGADARYVWVNESYRRWFGLAPDAIRGRHVREVLGEASWEQVRERVERALAGEEVVFDYRTAFRQGPARDAHVTYLPHRDAAGRLDGFVVQVTDVSELKSAERALRRSEHLLGASQLAAHVGSWEAEVDGDQKRSALRWSDETYRLFGFDPGGAPINHQLFIEAIHPDDREALAETSRAAITRGVRFETEYRIVRPDGEVRWLQSWVNVEKDEGGRASRLLGTCQDVTERRRAEQEIRRAREQLQLLLDSTPAFIAHFDRHRRLVWANKSYATRFGKDPTELVGTPLSEIVGEEGYPVVSAFYDRVLAGETIDTETEVTYPTIGRRFLHLMVSPTRDPRGAPDGCVSVITDVTRRHELERALRLTEERALDELKEAARQKDEFLAMLSHELRNPLAPILSAVEILRLADPSNQALSAEYRGLIERQVNLMKRLLDDLLDVARVSQGKITLRQEVIDLGGVVQNAVEISRPLMGEKEQRLSVTSAPGMILVNADATRLVQVFSNLLNNAAKYSARGGHIRLEVAVAGDEAIVHVRDEGIGIPPELLDRVFDLFVQETRSLDRAQGGLGIGLTMVRSLVRMHGGSVRAFSDGPGRGSEVVVRLPRAPAPPPVRESAPSAQVFSKTSHPLRILVVDDNLDAARALGTLLGLLGHQVTLAPDGPEALALIPASNPELVLIDIGLPKMDGYALAAAIRAAGLDRAALVAVTGYGREEDLRRSREAGFDHHLVKPIDLATLQQITHRPVGRGEPPDRV